MGCCATCCEGLFRFILFLFNLGLLGAGIALLIVGGIATKEFQEFADANLFESRYLWGPVALAFTVGILLLLIGFFGIGGLCCKNKCMLKAFIVFLVILMILEITIIVVAFVYKDEGETNAREGIRHAMVRAYGSQSDTKTRDALDTMQKKFKCCGSYNSTDYAMAIPPLPIPPSCCMDKATTCNQQTVFQKGCTTALFDQFEKYSIGLLVVCIVFAVLQVIGLIMAIKFLREEPEK